MKKTLLACFFLLATALAGPARLHLVILHTNDLHGHLLPYVDRRFDERLRPVGGFDRLAALVRSVRRTDPVLLLDAGDISQGTPISNLFFGQAMADSMNALEYDAAVVGNHEFDWGVSRLETFVRWCRFPVLAANVLERIPSGKLSPIPGTRPDLLVTVAGVRIGVIGVVTPETPSITKPENVKDLVFLPPAPQVKERAALLRKKGARMVLVLSHLGLDADRALARDVPDLDLIVGGHSHTVLRESVWEGRTMIVQTGSYCAYLGRVDVWLSGQGSPDFRYRLLPVAPGRGGSDPAVRRIIERYGRKVAPITGRVVGKLDVDLTRNPSGESLLGDAITDALREETGAEIAFQNSGGMRANLYRGMVRWGDVYTVLPFDDDVVTLELRGKDVEEILNQSLSGKHGLIQVSGLTYHFKGLLADRGLQAVLHDVRVDGKPLEPERLYRVATSDFLSSGGDGYLAFKNGNSKRHGRKVLDIFLGYLKRHSPLSIKPEGRVVADLFQ